MKDEDDEAEAAEPDMMGSDSEPEAATPGGTAGGTGEEASLGSSGSIGAEWSGVERSGVEWSGVERGVGLTSWARTQKA